MAKFKMRHATIHMPDGRSWSRECPLTLPGSGTRLMAGDVEDLTANAVEPVVALCRKLVPWAPVIACGRVFGRASEDGELEELGGQYLPRGERILLSLSFGTWHFWSAACHEAWHALEDRMGSELIDRLDAALRPTLIADGDEYRARPEERRANAFAAWCMRFLEGMPSFLIESVVDEAFEDAWSGRLGKALAKRPPVSAVAAAA